ncbi:MAG TPA: hypothetical protein VGB46_02195 [Flavisolibacter sp.]|jgi:hypothetical protein
MNIPWDSINGFAGATGIGAICVLGFFFIADASDSNVFHTLNSYASTATWGILAAVPTITISFLIGQFVILLGTFLAGCFTSESFNQVDSILIISRTQNEFLSQEYLRIKQEKEMLCGSALSFLVLGLGAFFEIKNLKSHRTIIVICGIIGLIAAVAFLVLGTQRINLLNRLTHSVSLNIESLKN